VESFVGEKGTTLLPTPRSQLLRQGLPLDCRTPTLFDV
jgi:hypothetical protein